jgi:hypothetical protein
VSVLDACGPWHGPPCGRVTPGSAVRSFAFGLARAELYEIARKRDLPGRSKMGRDELARKLGEN